MTTDMRALQKAQDKYAEKLDGARNMGKKYLDGTDDITRDDVVRADIELLKSWLMLIMLIIHNGGHCDIYSL